MSEHPAGGVKFGRPDDPAIHPPRTLVPAARPAESSGEYLRLETTGWRSGEAHSVLVRFVVMGRNVVVFPQIAGHDRKQQDWLANIAREPRVKVHWGMKTLEGIARTRKVTGAADDPLLAAFTRKYGREEVKKRYWGQSKYVEVEMVSQLETDDTYVDLFYADLEAAFDGVAESYDSLILGNPMNLWQRERSIYHLTRLFGRDDVVIEIGCGTGTETLVLAKSGATVIACDISAKMLQVLARKAAALGIEDRVIPVHARPRTLKRSLARLGYLRFDGAFSTFGAINTEPDLNALFRELHEMTRPGGKLLLGVWNRFCLYEVLGYAMRMKPSMALARFRNPVPIGRSKYCISTMAYSVGTIDRMVAPFFRREAVYGVGVFLPPSNLTKYLPPPRILGLSKRVEMAVEGSFPWNHLGDQFLGVYARRD